MTDTNIRIEDTIEAWESGQLGNDEAFVRPVSAEVQTSIDDSMGLQAISIRLPKDLIEQFKLIAKIHGMGYQPLMREALKRFAVSEQKILLAQIANSEKKELSVDGKQKVEIELDLLLERRAA
jgi:uncharacterized protein (DUF4415 family)